MRSSWRRISVPRKRSPSLRYGDGTSWNIHGDSIAWVSSLHHSINGVIKGDPERYEDFSTITRNSLQHALAESGEQLADSDITSLMKAYDSLSTFPDVDHALKRIASDPAIQAVVFSNGTKEMVSNSVLRSQDLSPHASIFQDLITVDDVKKYKPSRESYLHLAHKVGKQLAQMNEMWLISGNPFDIVGARGMGMNAIWVDRAGKGWQDAAVPEIQPTAIVHSLEHIVDEINGQRRLGDRSTFEGLD